MKTLKLLTLICLSLLFANLANAQTTPGITPNEAAIGLTDAFRDAPSFLALVADQINGYSGGVWSPSEIPSEEDDGNYFRVAYTPANLADLRRHVANHELQLPVANPADRLQANLQYSRQVKNQYGGYDWETMFSGWQDVVPVQAPDGTWVLPEIKIKMRLSGDPSLPLPANLSSLKIIERNQDGNIVRTYYPPITWESGGKASVRLSPYYAEAEGIKGEIILSYWQESQLKSVIFDLETKDRKDPVTVSGGRISADIEGVIIIEDDDVVLTLPQGGRVPAIQLIVSSERGLTLNIQAQAAGGGIERPQFRVRQKGNPVWGGWQPHNGEVLEEVGPGVYWIDLEFPTYGKGLPPRYSPPQEDDGYGKGGGGNSTPTPSAVAPGF